MPEFVQLSGLQFPADFDVEVRWVTKQLAIGGMIGTVRNMNRLREFGVTHVLDLQAEFDDSSIAIDTGITIIHLPVPCESACIPWELLRSALDFVPPLFADYTTKLFVHCMSGHHRAATFAYALLRELGCSARSAEARILKVDPRALLVTEDIHQIECMLLNSEESR